MVVTACGWPASCNRVCAERCFFLPLHCSIISKHTLPCASVRPIKAFRRRHPFCDPIACVCVCVFVYSLVYIRFAYHTFFVVVSVYFLHVSMSYVAFKLPATAGAFAQIAPKLARHTQVFLTFQSSHLLQNFLSTPQPPCHRRCCKVKHLPTNEPRCLYTPISNTLPELSPTSFIPATGVAFKRSTLQLSGHGGLPDWELHPQNLRGRWVE